MVGSRICDLRSSIEQPITIHSQYKKLIIEKKK